MVDKESYLMTEIGKENIEKELDYLKTKKRGEVLARIKHARTFCDFSEDSEFDAAIKEQSSVEERIILLEKMIQNAEMIKVDDQQSGVIQLGKSVTFIELPGGEEETYTIVGVAEAEPLEGSISNESPIAKSLLGHKVNDEITVPSPSGPINIKIVRVNG